MEILTILFISALTIQAADQKDKLPSILAWTDFFGSPVHHEQIQNRLRDEKCAKQCNIFPRSEMTKETDYDAIIFHSRDLNGSDVPKSRRDDQLYLLFSMEPRYQRGEERFGEFPHHFFNGTIGFSRLNNYVFDYDWSVSSDLKVTPDLIRSKTNTVFGVISNCNSRSGREEVIEELQSHMKLTLGGKCYNKNVTNEEFGQMMKSHRFVLALENQICLNYVTEKGFRYKDLIVPIVLSRQIAEEMIPSDAFIAVDDFDSMADLAEHLNRLQNDDAEYMKYFAWLDRNDAREVRRKGVCQLCTDLHSVRPFFHSSLLRTAFPDDNMCTYPSEINGEFVPQWLKRAVAAASILLLALMAFNPGFTLHWEIDNVSSVLTATKKESAVLRAGEFEWKASIRRSTTNPIDHIDFLLHCALPQGGEWSCAPELQLELHRKNKNFNYELIKTRLTDKRPTFSFEGVHWINLINPDSGFVNEDKIIIEFQIDILTARIKPNIDVAMFASPNEGGNVTLVIGDKRVLVSKEYLAVHSPVFAAMFFSNFAEKGKKEVEIKDVVYDEFIDLLHLIYSRAAKINDYSVPHILELSNRFMIQEITKEAESHLLKSRWFSAAEKLHLADSYRLPALKDHCLQSGVNASAARASKNSTECSTCSANSKTTTYGRISQLWAAITSRMSRVLS